MTATSSKSSHIPSENSEAMLLAVVLTVIVLVMLYAWWPAEPFFPSAVVGTPPRAGELMPAQAQGLKNINARVPQGDGFLESAPSFLTPEQIRSLRAPVPHQ